MAAGYEIYDGQVIPYPRTDDEPPMSLEELYATVKEAKRLRKARALKGALKMAPKLTQKAEQDIVDEMVEEIAQATAPKPARKGHPVIVGDQPLVVCGEFAVSCADMAEAQVKAAELAHNNNANVYILKPVLMIAPKRDVVTTELP